MTKAFTEAEKREAYERNNGKCHRCGKELNGIGECHHRKPRSLLPKGESGKMLNIMCGCLDCHREVHAKPKQNRKWMLHREDKITDALEEI